MATTKYFISGTSYSNLPTPNSISSGPSAPGSAVVANDTDVDINFSDGIGTAWSFSPTGMTFPDDTVQTTAYESKYKIYTALLTQTGTTPPTAIIIENNIGDIVWTYGSTGSYSAILFNAFTLNKTVVFISGQAFGGGFGVVTTAFVSNENQVMVMVQNTSGGVNDYLVNTPIEIRVYN